MFVERELEISEGERGPGQHPYLSAMFRFLSMKGNSIKMVCLLCVPAYKEVSAHVSSPSNLRKHIQVGIYKLWIMLLVNVTGWLICTH